MSKVICFNLDGTIANFYNVPFWLDAIKHEETYPYRHAQPLIPFDLTAQLVVGGYKLTIISWDAGAQARNIAKLLDGKNLI